MLIKVKDSQGTIYTNDMCDNAESWILEIHFGVEYTQVIVQDKVLKDDGITYTYLEKNIIIKGDKFSWIDSFAVSEDEIGEWVI